MKKIWAILFVLMLAVSLMTVAVADPATSGTDGGIDWKIESGTLTISPATSPTDNMTSGVMKDYSGNTPWYNNSTKTTAYNGKSFADINTIVIESGVTYIGNRAFANTTVSSVTIPNTVTKIGSLAFLWDCWLKDLTIPSSVTNMHIADDGSYYNPFDGTFNLESMRIDGDGSAYQVTQDGILIGPRAADSTELMVINCADNLGNGTKTITSDFPENTTLVGDTAFGGCRNLESISLPDTIEAINSSAFLKCYALKSFDVPVKVEKLEKSTFQGCSSLEKINLNNVKTIGQYVFAQIQATELDNSNKPCQKLTSIDLSNVTHIEKYAFQYSGLTSLTIPGGMLMDNYAFDHVESVTAIEFLGSYSIGAEQNGAANPFSNSKAIEKVTFADGSTVEITANIFDNCTKLKTIDLSNVTLKNGTIGNSSFSGCTSLSEVKLPKNSATTINYRAFYNTALKSIVIPASVTSIAQEAFNMSGLIAIDASAVTNCTFGSDVVKKDDNTVVFYLNNATVASSLTTTAASPSIKVLVNGGTADLTKTGFDAVSKLGKVAEWHEYDTTNSTTGAVVTGTPAANKTYIAEWIDSVYTVPATLELDAFTEGATPVGKELPITLNDGTTVGEGELTAVSDSASILASVADGKVTVTAASSLTAGNYGAVVTVTTPDGAVHKVTVTLTVNAKPASRPTTTPSTNNTIQSPKTFDAGIAVYGMLALTSAAGAVWVTKKR